MYFVHVYIYFLKIQKKKLQDFQIFRKKREKFSKKKKKGGLWTRGILPLSHFKKKKIFELEALDFLVTFSKRAHFFSYKDFKIL